MGRAEVGTPKYLANKMKAKGLQKLRWYCQMCQKQCRDENGFKCHTTSESHQRQLLLFADNSRKYLDEFSREFATGYLELLKRQFGTKRVAANRVYQEYIADRNHLHMNATKWLTLTGFVKWLGREGKCVVDETEKGWFVTYIDRDPETIAMQERIQKKEKMDKDDQERMLEFVKKQVKRGQKLSKTDDEPQYSELVRADEDDKVKISLSTVKIKPVQSPISLISDKIKDSKRKHESEGDVNQKKKKIQSSSKSTKPSALDEIIVAEEKKKEKVNRKDYWLTEDIIVKVVTKSLGETYYKKKGVVLEVIDKYSAKVAMLDCGHKLKLDQEHLETVIPAIGRTVKVVNGAYRGLRAILLELNIDRFSASIEIESGPLKGRKVDGVQYEDICKLNDS